MESLPKNYQCIITIPKLGSAFNREIGNQLAKGSNKTYGELKLLCCIHPHHAPAFSNFNEKHTKDNSTFPKVKLLESNKQKCFRTLGISQRFLVELEKVHKAKREQEHKTQEIHTN